jgi:peptidoglycan/xylan/chitin deacetylase (PgdA/CDA1 family)
MDHRVNNGGQPTLVTTSWDDGHPLDLRIAERLAAHGMTGTFYVPVRYTAVERMSVSQLRQLRAMGMEVGSHTVSHPRLSEVGDDAAFRELRDSRDALENILGGPVTSFCYPEGKLRPGLAELVQAAGYTVARTTLAFRNHLSFQPLAMPVSMQLYPHSRAILARHALREGNMAGLFAWIARFGRVSDPPALAGRMLSDIRRRGGILHIWGHSWEIENRGLWPALDRILEAVTRERDAQYLTNSGVLAALSPRTKTKYAVALQN